MRDPALTDPTARASRWRMARHLALLLVVSGLVLLPGLDRYGVYGWQEGQRLIVAREMDARVRAAPDSRGAWEALVVPRNNGVAYIAKPPLIYWAQLAAARFTGGPVELWHLRLVVALAGMAGVVAVYGAARAVLTPAGECEGHGFGGVRVDGSFVDRAALWAGLTLATGTLWVRSGRIGELDALLAAACATSIGGVALAWRAHRAKRRTSVAGVALGAVGCAAAALTKDPGVLMVALGGYGGIVLHACLCGPGTPLDAALVAGRGRAAPVPAPGRSPRRRRTELGVMAIAGVAGAGLAARSVGSAGDAAGAALIGLACAGAALVAARLTERARLLALLTALSRTHPVIVLGAGVAASVGWRTAVRAVIGPAEASALLAQEVGDNLRVFQAAAPLRNLWAASFGVGLGSAAAIGGAAWWARDRSRVPAGWWTLAAWVGLTLVAFSVLGKGVQRYLTPVWPGTAVLGGAAIASALAASVGVARARLATALGAAVAVLGASQGWYYAAGRERWNAEWSPRDFVRELVAERGVDPSRLVSFELSSPELAYYAGERVEPVGDAGVNDSMAGGRPWTVEELRREVALRGQLVVLLKEREGRGSGGSGDGAGADGEPAARLRRAGFRLEPIPTGATFRDSRRVVVRAYTISTR